MALQTITIPTSASYGGTGQFTVMIQTTPPAVAAHGNLWWNSETGRMHVYYIDATSAAWIQIGI